MTSEPLRIMYIRGPTALIEFAGLRFLTDRTFDPSGTEYPTPAYTLQKTQAPAVSLSERFGTTAWRQSAAVSTSALLS